MKKCIGIGNKVVVLTPIGGKTGIAIVTKTGPTSVHIKADWIPNGQFVVKHTDIRRATRKDFVEGFC